MPSMELQRRLAAEFERRGWEYDISCGRSIALEYERHAGRVSSQVLASAATPAFLARAGLKRADVEEAISAAVAGLDPNERRTSTPSRMRILFAAAGPEDEERLRLAAEHRDIRERLRASTNRDSVDLEAILAARPTDLLDEINRYRPTVLHLAGHGGPAGIALEDNDGLSADVSTAQLTELVASANDGLALVVLGSCESSHHARSLVSHVDAAVGMSRAIGDDSARAFAAQLYSSLAEGLTLGQAFDQAKLQVSLTGLTDDQIPELFTRRGLTADSIHLSAPR